MARAVGKKVAYSHAKIQGVTGFDMIQHVDNQFNLARSKLTQIFRYVQAFNFLQNPLRQHIQEQPWVLWLHELPEHPCIRRGTSIEAGYSSATSPIKNQNGNVADASNDDFILKVRRPQLTDPPEPPKEIVPWLQSDWRDVGGKVTLDPERIASFNDNPRRQELLTQWTAARNRWVQTESPARKVMDIFDRLYDLRAQLERENERVELMLGDGIIDWYPRGNDDGIHHPILLLRLQLHFNAHIPEFTLSATEHPPELYTALLQSLPDVNALNISHCRQEFEQDSVHPLGSDDTSQFLQRLVHQLSPRGEFPAQAMARTDKRFPLATRDPVLFLRSRTLGYNTALEAILESLPSQQDLPYALLSLTGIDVADNRRQNSAPSHSPLLSPNGEDEHILFSKPANAEQLEVAQQLELSRAVLVQGPPGTGKTHTIANLLGHLLAQGKSVLVTSHTSKALKVLREKVVGPLQPLCVSILEDDSRKHMERAIDAITERLSTTNADLLEREAMLLTKQRIGIIAELQKTREQLKEARYSEYRDIVLDGRTYSPSHAARYVAQNRALLGWIPTPITVEASLLLSKEELTSLYRTNATVPPKDEREMAGGLPDPRRFAPPVDFEHSVAERNRLLKEDLNFRRNLWTAMPGPSIEAFKQLQLRLAQALESLNGTSHNERWNLATMAAGHEGGLRRQLWEDLITKIESVESIALQAQPLLLEYDPFLSEACFSAQTEKVLNEIIVHLDRGGNVKGLTLFLHRDWKTLIEQARVNGQPPTSQKHFIALLTHIRLHAARKDLTGRWQRQMAVISAPAANTLGPEPERVCKQYIYQLRQCLDWFPMIWAPLEYELRQYGLRWDTLLAEMPVNLAEYGDLLRLFHAIQQMLPQVLAAEINRRMYAANEAIFLALQRVLDLSSGTGANAEVVQRLRSAVNNYDVRAYREAFDRLVDLYERQHELHLRHALLTKLEQCAPGWAAAIRHREGKHGERELQGDPQEAWLWRQLHDTLDRRSKTSLEELQECCVQLNNNLHRITAELVEKKAWAAQVRRTTIEQQRALQGWKELMRKVGKGTGKRAAQLLAEARRLIPKCQSAVPVWIMPLNRVVQNFDARRNHFDVVIIDEASQADIKALAAIYMGKQVVVVGDDEQVTPMDIGQTLEKVDKLINEHLQDIPLAKLYDGRLSIYALAKTTFRPIRLQEHFRCVSPIIQFSNALSYDGKIKPLRDDSEVKRRPATVAYRVQAHETVGYTNEPEAQAIASLLIAATEQPEYHDATFGVISMVNDKQAIHIDKLLQRYLSPTEYTRRQVLCGTPAHFQGDERDIIFLSMIDTPAGDGPLSLRSEDASEYMYKKRFNVAASRARDQLWVIHSLDPTTDLKDGDIRKRLILHANNPRNTMQKLAEQEKKVESEFEKQVLKRLVQAGYHVVPQWPVGAYRIDLVVEGGGKRLAVECDGDRWHPIGKLEEDMARQTILERLGWRFVRIRGSHFFRNPDQALEPVFARLRALEIPPEDSNTLAHAVLQDGKELHDQIVRRAAELRMAWVATGKRSYAQ